MSLEPAWLFGIWKNLLILPDVVSLVGCQAPLQGKPQWLVLSALEGGSGAVQVPAAWFPSCTGASLSPSQTAGEPAPPTGTQRHCNNKTCPPQWKQVYSNYLCLWLVVSLFTDIKKMFLTYSVIVSLQVVRTTQSMGRVVDRKWDFWAFLLRIGAERGPAFVASIIRRRLMTVWNDKCE